MLHYAVMCCIVLQYVEVFYNAQLYVNICCIALQCALLYRNVLQFVALISVESNTTPCVFHCDVLFYANYQI